MSLPSGYKRLEYIQSSGTQYVDTNVVPSLNHGFKVRFQPSDLNGDNIYIGCATSGSQYWGGETYNAEHAYMWNSGATVSGTVFVGQTYTTCLNYKNDRKFIVDGVVAASLSAVSITNTPIRIFGFNNGSTSFLFRGKIFGVEITFNDEVICDFIPCQKPDGAIGLWDDVNSVFYGNSGTGAFIAGQPSIGTHKALINGTDYEVRGGKCLVNGTVYDIQKGRTLIGGTGYDIEFAKKYDPVFANNTWEQIIAACHNNEVPDTWNVADNKLMTINGVDYQIDIIGKNHDAYFPIGTAPLTFQLHDCYADTNQMNSSNTNSGGWDDCAMRNTHLPAILAKMPTEVQKGIRNVNKLTSSGNSSSYIYQSEDKLFLLSEVEVLGHNSYSVSGEGKQYAYYKAGNSKVKKYNGSASSWWGRSPHASNQYWFCCISAYGDPSYYGAAILNGVAFGFCF